MEARESSSKAMKRLGMKLSAIAPCPRAVWCGARLLFAVSVIGCSVQAQEATSTPDRTPRAQRPGTIQAVSEEVVLDLVARDRHGRRSEEHTSELQSLAYLVCRLLLEKKKWK